MTASLLNGFKTFKAREYGPNGLMDALVEDGQDPDYFIISCIDSRSNPGTIFNARPGVFFAHKAMGAIVRPYKQGTALAAALEFALGVKGIRKLIVLGHTECGAIEALVNKIDNPEIESFVKTAECAYERAIARTGEDAAKKDILRCCEEEAVLTSLLNLEGYPSVQNALKDGLDIKGWMFDMTNADILEHNPKRCTFTSIINPQKEKQGLAPHA